MMEYFYRIYGLRVQSQIPFSEAVPETAGEAEVKIVFGRMPDFLLEAGQKGYGTWTNGFVSAWFRIRDGTQVYVEGGSRITVELSEEPQLLVITSLLAQCRDGTGLSAEGGTLFSRKCIVYRGTGHFTLWGERGREVYGGHGIVAKKAWILADDTVRVHPGTMGMLVEPSYPQQKLCRDMALKCGKPLEELIYIDEERDKYAWRRQDCYRKEAALLGKIFLLRKDAVAGWQDAVQNTGEEAVSIQKLTGQKALETLSSQLYLADTYRYSTGIPYPLMEQLVRIAGQAGIYEVIRQSDKDTLHEVVTKILQFC